MLKKQLLFIALLFCLFNLNAQEKNTIKLGIEPGILLFSSSENLGLLFNIEPKLKISKNAFMGLRIGIVLNPQKFENHDSLQFEIDEEFDEEFDNGGISFVPTIDYYLNGNNYRPYLGLGVGAYLLTSYVDVISNTSSDEFEVKVNKQVGVLLRGGFESSRLRFGLEYNFIQKADIKIPNGEVIGTVDNSYLGLSFGLIIGSGMVKN
ncbi:MAG: hypothetical protein HRT73_05085 [Flavobacteriales bacterium]|nr:hypothetical protein [Flavobacteriales bacterium]NQX97242.1 hypothetical protein [Flavobacteriales bacterium]